MSRKGENIYKRKDGRWEGRYIKGRNINNKAKYGYVYAHSYREVKDKLMKAKFLLGDAALTKEFSQEKTLLFHSVAEEWLQITQTQLKDSTIMKYDNLLNLYILPVFGDFEIKQITTEHAEKFANELLTTGGVQKKGLSPKTVSNTICLLRGILKYASHKENVVTGNLQSIQIKRSTKEMRVFSSKEQEKLCQYLYQHRNNRNIGILLCLFTGIRIGEVCALRWEDISLSEQTIYIHQTMQRIQSKNTKNKTKIIVTTPKSQCSIRTIPLPENLAKILAECSEEQTGYFLTEDADKFVEPRTMQNHFKKVLKENSIDTANFHVLRHTFATRCVELGFDIKSLSVILGHASVNITMNRYVHPSMNLKRENMQRLSELISVK